jgi:uncharacterized protein (TIGR02231 family)
MIAFLCCSWLLAQEPVTLAAPVTQVTVYPARAVVRRRAELPMAAGRYVVEALPPDFDAASLRVRGLGTEVVGVDVRERVRAQAGEERIAALEAKLADLREEDAALADEEAVLARLALHLEELAAPVVSDTATTDLREPALEIWRRDFAELGQRALELFARGREVQASRRVLEREIAELATALGEAWNARQRRGLDVVVDTFGGEGSAALELDYLVPNAGWEPAYDLRAATDLQKVELIYRARVWQATDEDWRGVELFLSTAEPERGAMGPEPPELWVDLADLRAPKGRISFGESVSATPVATVGAPARPYASVEDEGLSLRFRLPEAETIEAHAQPKSVLVGRATLAIEIERHAVPALDSGVWLRARATNTSEFALLAGRASVYLGADFLGHADLESVQRGAEFEMPLGRDPAFSLERKKLVDSRAEVGTFRGKRRLRTAWRIELKNHGAPGRSGGVARVLVQEALPESDDGRIEVELERPRPEPSEEERWEKLREEQNVVTWVLDVPPQSSAAVEFAIVITYPEGAELFWSRP